MTSHKSFRLTSHYSQKTSCDVKIRKWPLVSSNFKATPVKGCRVIFSFVMDGNFSFSSECVGVCKFLLQALNRRFSNHAADVRKLKEAEIREKVRVDEMNIILNIKLNIILNNTLNIIINIILNLILDTMLNIIINNILNIILL